MRKKSWKQVAAIVICAALLSGCTGENGQEKNTGRKEGQVVNIYCWNDEFKEIYDKYASDLAKKHDVEVNFVIISSDNNAYQINLDEALKEQNTCIDDDKVDLFLIEADYASKYVKSDNSIDVKKTVGLTDEDLKQQYDYTKKIVSENGIQKGVTWQATPGLFAYRRSIAKKVLGTDDPDQVQKQLKDWDKFDQVAQKMNAAGYKMLSGYDDSYRAFSNNVSHPWVVGNKIVIDENIKKWIRQTKEYAQKDYTYESSEVQRVFDDLMRLNAMSEYKHSNCIFIMCGAKKDFKNEFKDGRPSAQKQNLVNGMPISPKSKKKGRPRKYGNNNPYRLMFQFKRGKTRIINTRNAYVKKMVQEFENTYVLSDDGIRKFKDISSCVSNLEKIKTTLMDIIYDNNETTGRSAIGLWKVERA